MAAYSISSSFIIHHVYAIENNFTASHTNTHTLVSFHSPSFANTTRWHSFHVATFGGRMEKERREVWGCKT